MGATLPKITIKELLESGVHYGHKTMRWNPRMAPYLFGSRNGIHIIDLQKTAPLLHNALQAVFDIVSKNGRILFVGTKTQASPLIAQAAQRCGQYYVNHRWLGGMLTNWKTVSQSIKTLRDTEAFLETTQGSNLKKKEILALQRKAEKLRLSLGGIMDMGGKPDMLFVVDTNKESIAMQEARKLHIPVAAILDSNSNPAGVDFPIPGNDDATRSIELYCQLISDTVLAGIERSLAQSGVDIGSSADLPGGKGAKTSAAKTKKRDDAGVSEQNSDVPGSDRNSEVKKSDEDKKNVVTKKAVDKKKALVSDSVSAEDKKEKGEASATVEKKAEVAVDNQVKQSAVKDKEKDTAQKTSSAQEKIEPTAKSVKEDGEQKTKKAAISPSNQKTSGDAAEEKTSVTSQEQDKKKTQQG